MTVPRLRLATLTLIALISACSSPDPASDVADVADVTVDTDVARQSVMEDLQGAVEVGIEATGGAASPGFTDEMVLFGQSAAFSGPAQDLGTNMRLGIEAAFEEVNRQGGINGRQLELTTLDDGYEPEAAILNTQQLIEQEGVFALIGAVGTPTSRSAVPVAAEANIPYVAPFTGAGFLRDPEWTNIINLRASYNQETEEMVARLTEDLGVERIAVMYQDDSFGRAGYRGVRAAMERRGMEPVSLGIYTRNTVAVKAGVLDMLRGDPEAVIIVGAYNPVAATIRWARHIGADPTFIAISFVGSNALVEELGYRGAGVFVTQVVPFPTDTSEPIVNTYVEALAAVDSEATPGFVSLEGYIAGRLAIAGLERCGADLDRQCFLSSFEQQGSFDLDGFRLDFATSDNQGSDQVYLTVIDAYGEYQPVNTLVEAESLVTLPS